MKNKTLLYITDNSLDEKLVSFCRKKLIEEKNKLPKDTIIPIISVSQKPIDFGENICIGEIGRSWMSLYKAFLAGIEACDTDYIGIIEHDNLYHPEHLAWIPSRSDIFYYNANRWLVQWGGSHPELNGMYSYWPRGNALSQLICHKDLLRQSTEDMIKMLLMGLKVNKGLQFKGEPGLPIDRHDEYIKRSNIFDNRQLYLEFQEYIHKYKCKTFSTEYSNLDIRHSSNFTGEKRGKKRCYELPYWRKFSDLAEDV